MKPEYIKEYTKEDLFDHLLNLKWLEETKARYKLVGNHFLITVHMLKILLMKMLIVF